MERKLVSIQTIRKLMPIAGADFIEIALVNDWTVIVKKGEFEVGHKCCFFEIDCLLPEEPRYAFLEKSKRDYFGTPKYRIKTMKMRGVISQGLALPLSSFGGLAQDYDIGEDVSAQLNVIKYDPEFYDNKPGSGPKSGNAQGKFPSFIPKTDQERIQNLPHYYELYMDHEWEETLKLDGSSLTVYKISKPLSWFDRLKRFFGATTIGYHVGVCSRNLELKPGKNKDDSSDFWKAIMELDIDKIIPIGYAIQGELIGPKIQSNHEKVSQNQFWIFDVYDINNQKYLTPTERHNFQAKYFNDTHCHVPVTSYVKIFQECKNLDDLQKRVTGESINKGTVSEGRVYKSCTIPGLSFKCVSNEYLLKEK